MQTGQPRHDQVCHHHICCNSSARRRPPGPSPVLQHLEIGSVCNKARKTFAHDSMIFPSKIVVMTFRSGLRQLSPALPDST